MTPYAECYIIMQTISEPGLAHRSGVARAFCRTHGVYLSEVGCPGSLWNRLLTLEKRLERLEGYVQAEVPMTVKSAALMKAMADGKK